MAISTAVPTSFKSELLQGLHNFASSGGDTFKIALYTSSATMDATTTAYSATNEVSGTGYTAGGASLTNSGVSTSGTTGYTDFADASWSSSTITARGALIYNSTNSNRAAGVYNFGSDVSSTSGTFTVTFPAADASNAIIRLA